MKYFITAIAALLLAACGGDGAINDAAAQTAANQRIYIQTEWTQYRNAGEPLDNRLAGQPCAPPGGAYTAGTSVVWLQWMKPVKYARWVTAYIPRGGSVRLYHSEWAQGDLVVLGETPASQGLSPVPYGQDITAEVNQMIASGAPVRQFGLHVCGPALVYSSWIEVVH